MIPYLLVAIAPIAVSLVFRNINDNDKKKRNFLIICAILVFLLMGLRSRYLGSTDTQNYYNMMKTAIGYNSWNEYYDKDGVEVGFQVLVYLLSRIFSNPQALIIITSAIFVFSACFFIYHNSKDVVFSFVMYITLGLMTFQMEGMRQAIAMSICFLAYEFVKKRKFIPFLLCIVFAMSFHVTAIVFIAVYFVSNISYNWRNMTILIILSIIFVFLSNSVIELANEIFGMDYTNSGFESGGIIATLIYVLIIGFAILLGKNMKNDKFESAMFYILCIGAVCYIMRYIGTSIAERISFYFMCAQMIVLPNSMEYLKKRDKTVLKVIVYILMVSLFMYRLNSARVNIFLPYEFFWQ